MSSQTWEIIGKGFATRVLHKEAGSSCVECNNIFSENEKIYMMKNSDNTYIMCSSMLCFVKQGGKIDEYQTNTIISRKSIEEKPQSIPAKLDGIKPDSTIKGKVVNVYHYLHEIEDTLLEEERNKEFSTNGSKLGLYIKMAEEIIHRDMQEDES